jgi:predicted RNase H-like nuclease (RuvC/YqgF family)
MDNKEKPETLQEVLMNFIENYNDYCNDLKSEDSTRPFNEFIKEELDAFNEHASQQTEALQAEIDARRMQVTCLEDDNEALTKEVERLRVRIIGLNEDLNTDNEMYLDEVERLNQLLNEKDARSDKNISDLRQSVADNSKTIKSLESEVERLKEENKLIRDELSAETNLRVKDLRVKNTQLVEALRECIMYCHDDTAIERFKKALSQNNQPEK